MFCYFESLGKRFIIMSVCVHYVSDFEKSGKKFHHITSKQKKKKKKKKNK